MTNIRKSMLALTAALGLAACATIGGGVVGAGIGSMAGDAQTGAAVGATAGAVVDIFGR